MDSLFVRYANPFILLDSVIPARRFTEYVTEFIRMDDEDKTWEFYLHKVYDKSYTEFKESLYNPETPADEQEILETTLNESRNILNNFIPKG